MFYMSQEKGNKQGGGYQNPWDQKYEKYGDPDQLEAEIERDAKILLQKKAMEKIDNFSGYFEFLSNDFPA